MRNRHYVWNDWPMTRRINESFGCARVIVYLPEMSNTVEVDEYLGAIS